jgi:uncharacterized repeat protein (TIGR01451 family)
MKIPDRMIRRIAGVGCAGLLLGMGFGLPGVAAADSPPEVYWTAERMRGAQPYPLEFPASPAGAHPPDLAPQAQGDPGWAPSRAPDGVALPVISGNPPMTIPTAHTPTQVYTTAYGNLADNARFPHSAIGKIYFTMDGFDYSCSGAVVGENAIWTAGHCVSNGGGRFHTHWIFVPGYAHETSPYSGPWTAAYFIAPARFHYALDLGADYSVAIVNRVAGRSIRQMTGALGFAWNLPNKQLVRALGYPIPFYGGMRLVESEGYSLLSDSLYQPPAVGIYSKLKSGSSGGPWLVNFRAGAAGETNFLNGNVSFQKVGLPQVYSPNFDDTAKHLWDCAQYSTPETLDCHAAGPMSSLSLTDAGSSTRVAPGEPITHVLAVENHGDVPVAGIGFKHTVPAGASFASAVLPGGSCNEARAGVLMCALATLPQNTAVTATLVVTAPAPYEDVMTSLAYIDQASYGSVDRFVSSQDHTAVLFATPVREIDLRLAQETAPVVLPGAPFTYSLSIRNLGPRTANHVMLVDSLPPAVSFSGAALPGGACDEAGGVITCTLAALGQGDGVTATMAVTAPGQAGSLANLARLTADETDAWSEDGLTTTVQEADLILTKSTGSAAVQVGAPLRYTLTVRNRGPLAATRVILTDTLPPGVAFVSAELPGGSCAEAGGAVVCALAALANGGAVTATLVVTAPAAAGDIVNLASVTAGQADADPGNSLQISVTTRIEACWARIDDAAATYYPVQDAVDAARPGAVVKVAGTCAGATARSAPDGYPFAASVSQTVLITKDLTLRGGYALDDWAKPDPAAHPATLDALGQGRALLIAGAGISVAVEGLRLTGGAASGPGGGGAFILGARMTLRDNTFIGNAAGSGHGGGLYAQPGGQAGLSGNAFISNTAVLGGGGAMIVQGANARVNNNTFADNTIGQGNGEGLALYLSPQAGLNDNSFDSNRLTASAGAGGGLYIGRSDAVTVTRNTFAGNTGPGGGLAVAESDGVMVSRNVFSRNAGSSGGGMCLYASDHAAVSDNVFSRNSASANGGGLFIGPLANYLPGQPANVILRNNILVSNTAGINGGGLSLLNSSHITLVNTIIAANTAAAAGSGGSIQNSSVWLAHTTLANNGGGDASGLQLDGGSHVTLTNTILADHAVGIRITAGATVTVNAVLWHNTPSPVSADAGASWTVQNPHTGAPAFADPAGGNFHIGAGSAAIGRGIQAGVPTDIDGDQRKDPPDLGADEFARHDLWLSLVQR